MELFNLRYPIFSSDENIQLLPNMHVFKDKCMWPSWQQTIRKIYVILYNSVNVDIKCYQVVHEHRNCNIFVGNKIDLIYSLSWHVYIIKV